MSRYVLIARIARDLREDAPAALGSSDGSFIEGLKALMTKEFKQAFEASQIQGDVEVVGVEVPEFRETDKELISKANIFRQILIEGIGNAELRDNALRELLAISKRVNVDHIKVTGTAYDGETAKGTLEAFINVNDLDEIKKELAADRKIQAIKLVRQATGWGLKEAKEWIDAYPSGLPKANT